MIKKVLIAIMIALPMCINAQKFGIVNTTTIFDAMPEKATAQTQLETVSKQYEDEFKKLTDDLNKKYTEFQALQNDANTPESIKERRIQEIQELESRIQQFRATAQQDIQRQQQQLMAPIEEKIQTAIKAVGSENGYTFIFPDVLPLYVGTDVIDVTPLVKTKLGLQ